MRASGFANQRLGAFARRALVVWTLRVLPLGALALLLCGESAARGREFRYVDRSGRVHKIPVRRQVRPRIPPTQSPALPGNDDRASNGRGSDSQGNADRAVSAERRSTHRTLAEAAEGFEAADRAPPSLGARTPSRECLAAVREAAARYRVAPELILAVISVESSFDPNAVSVSGAMGLMQLLPGTARDLDVGNPFDVRQNVLGGTRYLRDLLARFAGDVSLALAAYNVGPGVVERWGGMPALPVALSYVDKVLRTYRVLVLAPPQWAAL